MPAKYVAVNLRIRYAHVKPCHVGTNILVNLPRERYWILGGRRSIRNVLSLCKRQNAKRIKVPRDPLPKDRVRDAVPFEVTRIDVARPSYLKTGKKNVFMLRLLLCASCAGYVFMDTRIFASFTWVSRDMNDQMYIYTDKGANVHAEIAFGWLDWMQIIEDNI